MEQRRGGGGRRAIARRAQRADAEVNENGIEARKVSAVADAKDDGSAVNAEERKAQLRQQIAETMERVRRLTAEQDAAHSDRTGTAAGSSRGSPRREVQTRRYTATNSASSTPSTDAARLARRSTPQYDPDNPFEVKGGRDPRPSRRYANIAEMEAQQGVSSELRPRSTNTAPIRQHHIRSPPKESSAEIRTVDTASATAKKSAHKAESRNSDRPYCSPVAIPLLSKDTSDALASLEATLARLRLRSPELRSSSDPPQPVPKPQRRPLSPSKELIGRRRSRRQGEGRDEAVKTETGRLLSDPLTGDGNPPIGRRSTAYQRPSGLAAARQDRQRTEVVERAIQTTTAPSSILVDKAMQYTPMDEMVRDERRLSRDAGKTKASLMLPSKPPPLRPLDGLAVIVDIRQQDGRDASKAWTSKLESLGAEIRIRPPPSDRKRDSGDRPIDYIVFRNGKPATLRFHRAEADAGRAPPLIVGVNWVQQCHEQGKHVDPRDYLVEAGKQSLVAAPKKFSGAVSPPAAEPSSAGLIARKKQMQHAPVRPSPLASRCWNPDVSTSSTATSATQNTTARITLNHIHLADLSDERS